MTSVTKVWFKSSDNKHVFLCSKSMVNFHKVCVARLAEKVIHLHLKRMDIEMLFSLFEMMNRAIVSIWINYE